MENGTLITKSKPAEQAGENGTAVKAIDLKNPSLYINRELSQIEFNRRVLEESRNPAHPLLERVKFLAIFNANMDEFFMVRVSGLKQQVLLGITKTPPDGLTPREQLVAIHRTVTELFEKMMGIWQEELKPALAVFEYRPRNSITPTSTGRRIFTPKAKIINPKNTAYNMMSI